MNVVIVCRDSKNKPGNCYQALAVELPGGALRYLSFDVATISEIFDIGVRTIREMPCDTKITVATLDVKVK